MHTVAAFVLAGLLACGGAAAQTARLSCVDDDPPVEVAGAATADALRDGRLVRLSPLALPDDDAPAYWLVFPPEGAGWPPLVALHRWLRLELKRSARGLPGANETRPAGSPPGRRPRR